MDDEIKQMPEFKSKVPENARRAMPEDQLWLADTISIIEQKIDWGATISLEAYNTSIRNKKQIEEWKRKLESPMKIVWGIIIIAANVGIAILVTRLLT